MITCPFCNEEQSLSMEREELEEHLIVLKNSEGHMHVHGPLEDRQKMKEFILIIAKEAGIKIEDS